MVNYVLRKPYDEEYETIKAVLYSMIVDKYYKERNWISILTEFPVNDEHKTSIFFDSLKEKRAVSYEIIKNTSEGLEMDLEAIYNGWSRPFMEDCKLVVINLEDLPKNLDKLRKYLRGVIE